MAPLPWFLLTDYWILENRKGQLSLSNLNQVLEPKQFYCIGALPVWYISPDIIHTHTHYASYPMLLDLKILGEEKVIKIALNLEFENV
jgi:hypothetical protein